MELVSGWQGRVSAIAELFATTFSASEGEAEGALIGALAARLISETDPSDLFVFYASEGDKLVGAIFFSRLRYDADHRRVFVLAPVAIATEQQGRGKGQALIAFGLSALRQAGVDIAVTYGDPAFYSKIGFEPISETLAPAPFRLQMPQGWLGQSLSGEPLTPLKGAVSCVPALNDAAFW